MEYPGEWMYNQRAYPANVINTHAIKNAESRVKEQKEARNAAGLWEFKGPFNTGGRVTDAAISPVNDDHLYVAAALGGVFKTTDKGVTWHAIFDEQGKLGIGNIEIAPTNPDVLYVGTGEANASATSGAFFGDGIYKSIDAGATWIAVGLPESQHIARSVINPTNENRVFVATTGILYGTNSERGIYRTENGGTTWERVLFIADGTAAIDIVINGQNPDILFAAMWERSHQPWQRDYGGLTSAVYRSTDGGENFTEFVNTEISNVDAVFGWYFGNIRVNPNNLNDVFVLGQRLYRTLDAATTWNEVIGMHLDHHAMEFSQINPNFMLAGNDGGAYISEANGTT